MSSALNPVLYGRLKKLFGSVRISAAGEAMVSRPTKGADNEPLLVFDQDGEYYMACCPFCADVKHRLYVNHMFGKRDAFGRRMNFLAYCFNEDCLSKGENRADFLRMLEEQGGPLLDASVGEGTVISDADREVTLPGPCRLLNELPATHKARGYILSRGFDPDMLAVRYGVCYCDDSHYFLARDRLIIPVWERGKLKGWQARYIGELPWKDKAKRADLPPKYFSCPRSKFRSSCLYNWIAMKEWETGVIVEGPTDVWRFGPMAGCIFGNTITPKQEGRLKSVFKKRTLVMLLDPEEYDSRRSLESREKFKAEIGPGFCAVKLPLGTDPGSLDRAFLRGYVKEEAARQGVAVKYRKWVR